MFKKILLCLVVLSPLLWTLTVGYPVNQHLRRTYNTDNIKEYLYSLRTEKRIAGLKLVNLVFSKMKQLWL
jgi:hypothetical protein